MWFFLSGKALLFYPCSLIGRCVRITFPLHKLATAMGKTAIELWTPLRPFPAASIIGTTPTETCSLPAKYRELEFQISSSHCSHFDSISTNFRGIFEHVKSTWIKRKMLCLYAGINCKEFINTLFSNQGKQWYHLWFIHPHELNEYKRSPKYHDMLYGRQKLKLYLPDNNLLLR